MSTPISSQELVFSRPFAVERIKNQGRDEKLSARDDELPALAQLLGLESLSALKFECNLQPWKKGGVRIKGQVTARFSQICVVSLEEFETEMAEDVDRYFLHPTKSSPKDDIIDLEDIDLDEPDEIESGSIDLGVIASETLALSLSQHPRKPGAVFEDHIESNPNDDDQAERKNPFDVLKNLKTD